MIVADRLRSPAFQLYFIGERVVLFTIWLTVT